MKRGDVVVVPFPFREAVGAKLRPALVLVELPNNEAVLCMITSSEIVDGFSIPLLVSDFTHGDLPHNSYIRPNRLFTADVSRVQRVRGTIAKQKLQEVLVRVVGMFSSP